MKIPPYLKQNDEIRLIAPSRFIEEDELIKATTFFQQNGFSVSAGNNILKKHHQFAGTLEERSSDLQSALDDRNVKAIIAFRGGYGAAKIIDHIDWKIMQTQPKWLCGYSDFTAIHFHAQKMNVCSLHSTMPIHLKETDEESILSFYALMEVLKGEPVEYYLQGGDPKTEVEGEIIGGNLSVIYSIHGSQSDFNWNHKVLFLEDLDEYLYHIDRMMNGLNRSGKLKNLAAIVLGSFTQMNDNQIPYGQNAVEIIRQYADLNNVPFFTEFPAGHQTLNLPIRLGAQVKIKDGIMVYAK
jgi:muramoyltetrapeptide carboxypeptidase